MNDGSFDFASNNIESLNNVNLEPVVSMSNESIDVSFRIVDEKTYLVKDVSELIYAYEEKGNYSLGTKSRIDFSFRDFDEHFSNFDARELLDFIRYNDITEYQDNNDILLDTRNDTFISEADAVNEIIDDYGDDIYEVLKEAREKVHSILEELENEN